MNNYRSIEHHYDSINIGRNVRYAERLVKRNLKKINVNGAESISQNEIPNMLIPEHSSNFDPIVIPLKYYEITHRMPVSAAGKHLISIPILGERLRECGACVVKRKPSLGDTRLLIDYLAYVLAKEKKDIIIFPGVTERGTGRSWNGKHQTLKRSFVSVADQSYTQGTDVYIIPCNVSYDPYVPEEGIFPIRARYNLPFIEIILDLLYTFIPKREITAHISFGEPYLFSRLTKMFSGKDFLSLQRTEKKPVIEGITKFIEKKDYELYMPTSTDLLCHIVKRLGDSREYITTDIIKQAKEMYFELLDKKFDVSLINLDELENRLGYMENIFEIKGNKTRIKNDFLLEYHSNHLLNLL